MKAKTKSLIHVVSSGMLWTYCLVPGMAKDVLRPKAEHVILVSIDGFRPHFYLSDKRKAICKTMITMRKSGAYAKRVLPPYPSLTYPSHAAIITGVSPARHKITANTKFRPPKIEDRGFWFARDVKVKTLWERADKVGLKIASLSWPSSADTQSIDWNFPEFWSSASGPELYRMKHFATPAVLKLADKFGGRYWGRLLSKAHKRDTLMTELAVELIKTKKPNLVLLHLIQLDKYQHRYRPSSRRINTALMRVDQLIRKLRHAVEEAGIKDETAMILLGDHGFSKVDYSIAPNALLVRNGFITMQGKKVKSWKAMVKNTGGSAGVYLKDVTDSKTLRAVRALFEKNNYDEEGEPRYEIIEKEELLELKGPSDPVFYLEAEPLIYVFKVFKWRLSWIRQLNAVFCTNHLGQKELQKSLDIPTVAVLLGFEMPKTDGRVLEEILITDK